jgi:hypothetical protein
LREILAAALPDDGRRVTPEEPWRAAKRTFLFPIRAVNVVFRGKFLAAVRRELMAVLLQISSFHV